MFDLLDEMFGELVKDHFSVLDADYVDDICRGLLPSLQSAFDLAYDTKFIILEKETGKPMSCNAILNDRKAAEEFVTLVGDGKYEIGMLVIDS